MKKKKIKLCLTKQLLNMFKLWCEWGINKVQIFRTLCEILQEVTFSFGDENFMRE